MSRNKKRPLSKPVMVRLEQPIKEEIEGIARANDISASDIIRFAIARHLPAVRDGLSKLRSGT